MIILNEKAYVDGVLRDKTVEPSNVHTFLRMYARYLYHEKDLRKTGIIEALDCFMHENYPYYNSVEWSGSFEKYANRAGKYPLCECNGIWVTKKETQTVADLRDKVLERLAFTLLCLAKFGNFRNPNNHNWLHYSNGEIYSMACINTTAFDKDVKLHTLRERGMIAYAKKINNLGIQVLYADDGGAPELFISDFRKLGYEWRTYQGEAYIRCAGCGILTKKKKGTTKFCTACRKENDLIRYRRYNEKRKNNHTQTLSQSVPND